MRIEDADHPLAMEIRQEAAGAYFAACRKMVDALEALSVFDRTAALKREDKQSAIRRAELIGLAAERVYFVVIQREAMKLSCTEHFFDSYDVPQEVRARLGPRRS